MAGTNLLWYLDSFWAFLAQKFSSQGQVNSIRTTVLILLENKTRSGRSVEIAIWGGKMSLLFRSTIRVQSGVKWMRPLGSLVRFKGRTPAGTKSILFLAERLDLGLDSFMILVSSSWRATRTESWRHVYRCCTNAVLQPDKTCAVVQIRSGQRVHLASNPPSKEICKRWQGAVSGLDAIRQKVRWHW